MNTLSSPRVSRSDKQTTMKPYPTLFLAALCAALLCLVPGRLARAADAKPPTQLTYQGFLTDANGVPLGNTAPLNKTLIFRIYDAATAGNLKWSAQQVVTLDKGHFSVLLGEGSQVGTETFNADLTSVFSGSSDVSDRYLQLTVDGVNIAPRLRFLPAPYAVHARTATQLMDPLTGASSLSIASGNITASGTVTATGFSGSGASLKSIPNSATTAASANTANAIVARDSNGNFAAGIVQATKFSGSGESLTSIPNTATTATNANTANAIVARDGSGNFTAGTVTATSFSGSGTSLTGIPNTATTATSANTANAIVARDASGNLAAGQVVATSFKIKDTPTLVLSSISRVSLKTNAPLTGVAQTFSSTGVLSYNGTTRPNFANDVNWWKSTNTTYGSLLYTGTFTVPVGEMWEVVYACHYYILTDDLSSIVMSLNDVLPDDWSSVGLAFPTGFYPLNQTFILSAGTNYVRVKVAIGQGSGSDSIYFPLSSPTASHLVVRKYKSN